MESNMYVSERDPIAPSPSKTAPPPLENRPVLSPQPPLSAPEFSSTDLLPAVSHWMRWGGLAIASSTILAIGLAAVTPYSVTVRADVMVRPVGESKQVEATTSGTVVDITATENQQVQAGDIIARLDDSRLQTRQQQLRTQLEQGKRQQQQIDAQIQTLQQRLQIERDRIRPALRSGQAELRQAHRTHQEQSMTATTSLTEVEADLRAEQAHLAAAQLNVKRYQGLSAQGAVAHIQVEEAQLSVRQRQEAIAAIQAKRQRLRAALNPSPAVITIAQETIHQMQSGHEDAIATLTQEKEALVQQRVVLQQQYRQDQQDLRQADHERQQTQIVAPVAGTLFQLQLRNAGQAVAVGDAIANIAPQDALPTVKARVTSTEISRLQVGQIAQLRITSCPYTDYGTLKAVVKHIAPDVTASQFPNGSSTTALPQTAGYELTLKPEEFAVAQGDRHCQLQAGMVGTADITTEEESVLTFVLRKVRLLLDV